MGYGFKACAAGVVLSALAVVPAGCYAGVDGIDRDSGVGGGGPDGDGGAEGGESEGETEGESDALDPGRVTMHRLTNTEYDNTIRDLFFGLPVQPSQSFPADEVSLGFDNISEVLSVTPVLFELYERAANEVIAQALTSTGGGGGESQRREAEDLGGTAGAVCCGGFWNLSSNGEIDTTLELGGGEHEIVVRAYGQPAGPDLPRMVVSIDGTVVEEVDVTATANAPSDHTITADLDAGSHTITVAFTNDYFDQASGGDRNLYIDWVEVNPLGGGSGSIRDKILTCEPAAGDEAECFDEILRGFGRRAWRRPLTDAEVDGLVSIVEGAQAEGQSFEASISLGLTALLVSPHFLFRVELDPDPTSVEPHPLSDHELASRLSYLMWSSMPDNELMDRADEGELHDPAVLEQQVRRMLKDERASALIDNFAGQWLYLRNISGLSKDYEAFPEFDDALQASMRTEAEMFMRTFMDEDRSLRELLTADDTFVDARLAEHYGIAAPDDEGFSRVSLEGLPRRGLLTQAGILSVLSHSVTTSPVKRGKWVLEQLMCIIPPPPPPGVDAEPIEPSEGTTMREQLEQHRADPNCSACHELMDPIGLGLENYDAIGRFRDVDGGQTIDASGNLPDGKVFGNAMEMVDALSASDDFARCIPRKTLTYALGRDIADSDAPHLEEIQGQFVESDMTLEGLLVAVVLSEPFRMRRGEQ